MRLEIDDLRISFGARQVVDLEHLDLDECEIVGLVGESGSGKSMTALAILGLAHGAGATVSGSIRLDGKQLVGASEHDLRSVRGRRIAMIFQAPVAAFNPVFRVGDVFRRTLRLHGASAASVRTTAANAMRQVRLSPELLRRYPHQLSGGQAQRVAIALALALRAEVLIADEPTSALDVTVQAEILELLRVLRDRERLSVLFISHDLAVVAELCQRVAIMRAGELVESGLVGDTLSRPSHPYTRQLLAAVPRLHPGVTTNA
jgi:peptide/nickel transport system ATP-binding protein